MKQHEERSPKNNTQKPNTAGSIAGSTPPMVRAVLCILLACALSAELSADISLREFITLNNFDLYWDDITQRGIIYRGSELVSFQAGFELASLNLSSFVEIEAPYYRDALLYLPETTQKLFYDSLLPRSTSSIRTVSTIYIDPGHGGRDPGAVGRLANGEQIFEKDIVLAVGQQLKAALESRYPGKEIIISRDNDTYLRLEERTEKANALSQSTEDKVLFISLHVNAALNKNARGIEVWYLPPEYRRQVIAAENIDPETQSVAPILNSILEEEYTVESIILAQNIERAMLAELADRTISRGLKEMDWYVVRRAFMPSVLVELGFISNATEVEYLSDPAYLQDLSRSVYNGIVNFIQDFESVRN